jgi:hypothetical protein
MEIPILKNTRFSGKGRQSLHTSINVMTFHRMVVSYVTLDHILYSKNYGNDRHFTVQYCLLINDNIADVQARHA